MAYSGQSAAAAAPGLTVTNTTGNDVTIGAGTVWTTQDSFTSNGTFNTQAVSPFDCKLARNSLKKMVAISGKVEEIFEYAFRICPEENHYGSGTLSYNLAVSENQFSNDGTSVAPSAWNESLITSVKGDEHSKMKKSELIHATAKMLYLTMCFRKGMLGANQPRTEPATDVKLFFYEVAKGLVLEDAELVEEPLAKMALLTI